MATLLYIEASPRGENSRSSQAAQKFIEGYKKSNPEGIVDHLNVFEEDLPDFDQEGANQKMSHIADLIKGGAGQEAVGQWAGVIAQIDRLKAADKVLLSCPMWNFSIPYRLKHYFDLICQPALTFYVNGKGEYKGLVKGKPMQFILTSGSAYPDGFPQSDQGVKTDFQTPYLQHIAGYIGFKDIRALKIQSTDALLPADFAPIFKNKLIEAYQTGEQF